MNPDAWFALGVVGVIFYLLAFSRLSADLVLILGVALLLLVPRMVIAGIAAREPLSEWPNLGGWGGVLTAKEGLVGLSNEAVVAVGLLFVVGAGVRDTGGVTWIAERLFGRPKTTIGAIIRLMLPTAALSAFMNNTPLVAMLIPAVSDFSKQHRMAASKLMIPLSYAAILGGTCTLIGTSTNLVVDGLVKARAEEEVKATGATLLPREGLNMFDVTRIGMPAAIAGIAFIVFVSRWLLPDRRPVLSNLTDPREYTIEMLIPADSPLAGKTIEQAGLRHLPGAYLAEIDRHVEVIPAVAPHERLQAGDRLVFVGIVESVIDLQKIRGLLPATDQVFKLTSPRSERSLIEAVVSNTCPLVGQTIRDGRFRSRYDAVVIAVARNGERVNKKIGDIVLEPGDTLLLEAHPSFADRQRNSRDFFLVSRLENSTPPRHEKAVLAIAILMGMVTLVSLNWLPLVQAALLASVLMLITRCCTIAEARRSIDWEVLLAIAASFAMGASLEKTGAADAIAGSLIGMAKGNPWLSLAVVYVVTLVVTELITNNAAAALMFPLALSTAETLGVHHMPFIIAIMMAASAGFATPIGYQTNLMVYGPGGYRFNDYLKIGVPLDILVGVVSVLLTPLFFPFYPGS